MRRRLPRYPIAVPVDVTVLRAGVPASIPGRSLDLAEGGVAAVLAGELQMGEWVAVALQLPSQSRPLQTKAVVRHHDQMRCGLEFLGLSRDQRYMIRRWAGVEEPQPTMLEPLALHTQGRRLASAPYLSRRRPASILVLDASSRRLLARALAAFLVVALVAAWQWRRAWQELESRTARVDAHAHPPAARVPAEVMERLLVRRVDPVYPEVARRANLQGTVSLGAVVAADGSVVNIYPVKGVDGLTAAAMDAVRWWRFRPFRIKGAPAVVETTLAVEFRPQG